MRTELAIVLGFSGTFAWVNRLIPLQLLEPQFVHNVPEISMYHHYLPELYRNRKHSVVQGKTLWDIDPYWKSVRDATLAIPDEIGNAAARPWWNGGSPLSGDREVPTPPKHAVTRFPD